MARVRHRRGIPRCSATLKRTLHHRRPQARHRTDGRLAQRRCSWPGIGRCTASACSWWRKKASGKFVGRVGPFYPPVWPGFEVGWGTAGGIPWQGLCGRSGAGFDRLGVRDLRARRDRPLHRSARTSPRKPWRGGSAPSMKARTMLLSHAVDLWVTHRSAWRGWSCEFEPVSDVGLELDAHRTIGPMSMSLANDRPCSCALRRSPCCWCWRPRCGAIFAMLWPDALPLRFGAGDDRARRRLPEIGSTAPISIWHAPLIALSTGDAVVLWLFTRALLDDAVRAALVACADLGGRSRPIVLSVACGSRLWSMEEGQPSSRSICLRSALSCWRSPKPLPPSPTDLVERRRNLRVFIVSSGAALWRRQCAVATVSIWGRDTAAIVNVANAAVLAWHRGRDLLLL